MRSLLRELDRLRRLMRMRMPRTTGVKHYVTFDRSLHGYPKHAHRRNMKLFWSKLQDIAQARAKKAKS